MAWDWEYNYDPENPTWYEEAYTKLAPGGFLAPWAAEELHNLTTLLGGGLGGILRSQPVVSMAERFSPGGGADVYRTGTALEEWALPRDVARMARERVGQERLKEAMGGAYQPPAGAKPPATTAPTAPPPTTAPPVGPPPAAPTAQESWDDMARRVAARQYKPGGYLERMGQTAGEGLDVGRVIGRAAVPGQKPGLTIHEAMRPASDTSIAAGEQDKRRSTYTPSLGAAEARARLRGQTGAFTPSRQLPPSDVSREFVAATESPMIQRLWDERRRKELGLDYTEALTRQQQARTLMLESQAEEASLPPEQKIKRQFERISTMHRLVMNKLNPDVDAAADKQFTLAMQQPEVIKSVGNDAAAKKMLRESIRSRIAQEKFNELMAIMNQMIMLIDPSSAAISRLMGSQLQYGYGMPGQVGTGVYPPAGRTE